MLQDEVTITLEPESVVKITPVETVDLEIEFWPEVLINLEYYTESSLVLDIETMGFEEGSSITRLGKIYRLILFAKSVLGHKTTFGRSNFVITNHIQTMGTLETTDSDLYGGDTYGDGIYGDSTIFSGIVSRSITFNRVVSGIIVPSKTTAVAEVSLGSHGTPSSRTNHSIKIRARTTSGSTGVIKAALYEGTTNRSGTLLTPLLSNTLTDYALTIPDGAAATITDYSNLSIRFWGFDSAGNALVFEISKIHLELPVATGSTTYYGSISSALSFGKSVSGVINSKRTTTAEVSLASHGTPSSRTNHSIKIRARTTSGSTGVLKAELYEGSTVRSGFTPLATSSLTTSLADYTLAIPDASAATITDYSNLSIRFWGFDSAGNALVFEVSKIYLELPTT